jgi:hypothetical protein
MVIHSCLFLFIAFILKPISTLKEKPMSTFVKHCPEVLYSTLLDPLLPGFCVHVFNRLNTYWTASNSLSGSSTQQEILENNILRELTREHLDFIKILLEEPESPSLTQGNSFLFFSCSFFFLHSRSRAQWLSLFVLKQGLLNRLKPNQPLHFINTCWTLK